jgi:nanoRNase/pAp phosphatase (c-di-AMP/oligoRNAs hydrolase)
VFILFYPQNPQIQAMAFELNQQILEAINRSRQILIVFRNEDNGDGLSAGLALAVVLKKMNKQVELVSHNFDPANSLKFLPGVTEVRKNLPPLQKFVIKVDVSKNRLESLSYDVKDENLYVYITPKDGIINRDDVKTASTDLKYDLIFVLDAPDLESLGAIYDNNTELFFRTPVVNIDHNPANENFGKINLVDITVSSTAEILFEFFQQTLAEHLDKNVANLLLTGLIAKTKNFRYGHITSRTLNNAGKLVDLGADRETIVQRLYRQRSLAVLKLWGEALVHLKHDAKTGLVWLSLKRDDFRHSQATENELPEIIDEILNTSPEAKTIVLLYETAEGEVAGLVTTQPHLDAKTLTRGFNPLGTKNRVKISSPQKDLATAEAEIIGQIKMRLAGIEPATAVL